MIKGSYVPPETIRRLRQYDQRIFDLTREIVNKLTKPDACLQRCNIRISNYVSSTDSKGYKGVVSGISQGITDPQELVKEIHGRTINRFGKAVIIDALTGMIHEIDMDVIRQLKAEVDLLERHKNECRIKMNALCKEHFPKQLENLQTIPGIKERSATAFIAEVGVDMKMFLTAFALVSWCGLKPRNEESAGKIKSRRITHGNKFLRKTLIECVWAASRTQGCFFNRFSYIQVTVRKKNQMKVKVAIARKMPVVIWHILSKTESYREILDHRTS